MAGSCLWYFLLLVQIFYLGPHPILLVWKGIAVWAKAGRRIWGLGHVFEGKLQGAKDIFITVLSHRIRIPTPAAKDTPNPKVR